MEQLKQMIKMLIGWINTKGFTALTALVVGVGLWMVGAKISAGVAFGVFFTRNWDILKEMVTSFKK